MTKIIRQEVLKIARLSRIAFPEAEVDRMAEQLEEVVTYARRVGDIAAEVAGKPQKNINVFRADVVISNRAEAIQAQAPDSVEHFFVVPAVIEANE